MIIHAEGFETFALADDRTAIDDAYEFAERIGTADATIVTGYGGRQSLSIDTSATVVTSLGRAWGISIGGLTSDSTLIRGWRFKAVGLPTGDRILLTFDDSENDALVTFVLTSTGSIKIQRGELGGTLLEETAAGVIVANTDHYIEAKVTFHASAGSYELKVDGTSAMSGSGVSTTATGGVRCYQVWHGAECTTPHDAWIFEDCVLIDTQAGATGNEAVDFIGDVFLERVAPNANGTNDWTPSSAVDHYTLLNEDGEDGDTSYIESNTAAQQELNGYEDAPAGGNIILGVLARPVLRKTDGGSRTYKLLAGSGATVGESDPFALSTEYQRQSYVWETDPDTGQPWTITKFNAATFGIELAA